MHTDLVGGGIEQMMTTLATHTQAEEVGICWCPANHPEPSDATLRSIADRGIALYRIPPPFLSPRYPLMLAALVAQLRPDVLHLHGGTIGCVGGVVGRVCGVPVIVYTEHLPCHPLNAQQAAWCHAQWIRGLRTLTAGSLDATVAISRTVEATLPHTSGTSLVVHNGIELSVYAEPTEPHHRAALRAGFGVGPTDVLLAGVGSLTVRKAYDVVVRAIGELPLALRRHVHLVVCGEGNERASIEALRADLDLESRVHLLGWRDDVPELLRSADAFVHPAMDEGFGLVVVEAAAAGLPIVASDVGGIPEIIEHGVSGLLVPPGEPQALAGAIQELIDDPERARRLGEAARRTAFERFSAEAMAAAYMELYERLLREKQ